MAHYKPTGREQNHFLALDMEKQYSKNEDVRVVERFIDNEIDIAEFDRMYKNDDVGQKAINPKVILGLIVFGYIRGVSSMRKLSQLTTESLPFIYLSGNKHIEHSTLSKFLHRFRKYIKKIFSRLLYVMNEMNLIDWSYVMIDGTKVSSAASKNMSGNAKTFKKKLEQYEKLSGKLIARSIFVEKMEMKGEIDKEILENERRLIKRQNKLYESAISTIEEYLEEVECGEIDPKMNINLSDRDSCLVKQKQSYEQGYNVQTTISANDIILSSEATSQSNDKGRMKTEIEKVKKLKKDLNIEKKTTYLLDKGYFKFSDIKQGADEEIEIYSPMTKNTKKSLNRISKIGDDGIFMTCKGGVKIKGYYSKANNSYIFKQQPWACDFCKYYKECRKNNKEGNKKVFSIDAALIDDNKFWREYQHKHNTEYGRIIYGKRFGKEHVFSNQKDNEGLDSIRTRGKIGADTASILASLAHNFKKLGKALRDDTKNYAYV